MESIDKNCRVLIVSSHALFAEAIFRLLQEQGIEVVAKVGTLAEAEIVLQTLIVEAIVVDYDDPHLRDSEVVAHLVGDDEERQVIFLTLAGNQMIVHHREKVKNVTPADLISAIRFIK